MDLTGVMLRVFVLLGLALLARVIENANKVIRSRHWAFWERNIGVLYSVANVQASLSTGSLGLLWTAEAVAAGRPAANAVFLSPYQAIIVACLLAGSISRGLLSNHEPQRASLRDWDWTCGVVIPNALGIGSLILAAVAMSS